MCFIILLGEFSNVTVVFCFVHEVLFLCNGVGHHMLLPLVLLMIVELFYCRCLLLILLLLLSQILLLLLPLIFVVVAVTAVVSIVSGDDDCVIDVVVSDGCVLFFQVWFVAFVTYFVVIHPVRNGLIPSQFYL